MGTRRRQLSQERDVPDRARALPPRARHHFRYVRLDAAIGNWAWIVSFGLLLIGVKVKGL